MQASDQALEVLLTDLGPEDEAKGVIRSYMASLSNAGLHDTKVWLEDIQLSVRFADRGVSIPLVQGDLGFARMAHFVEEMDGRYGRSQDIGETSV